MQSLHMLGCPSAIGGSDLGVCWKNISGLNNPFGSIDNFLPLIVVVIISI